MPLFLPGLTWSVHLLLKQGVGKDNSAFLFFVAFFVSVWTNEFPGSVKV